MQISRLVMLLARRQTGSIRSWVRKPPFMDAAELECFVPSHSGASLAVAHPGVRTIRRIMGELRHRTGHVNISLHAAISQPLL